jgi:hypothetical protein
LIWLLLAVAAADPVATLAGLPRDVRTLIERRWSCNHWAGEEPYDRDRAREIAAALKDDRCERIDVDERTIRRRYAKRADVLTFIEETRDGL